MEKSNVKYDAYIRILEEELVPAMGCTEPIAIAYGAAKGREVLPTCCWRSSLRLQGSSRRRCAYT